MLLFLVSHIVIIVHPGIQFDVNYLQLFRILDIFRLKSQPLITDLLKKFPNFPSEWIESGRPCSPRVLFVFESYEKNNSIILNRRKYEQYLEDQIYRFLRKSRIITNICANSLFAICNQNDFVFISTKDPTVRDPNKFFMDLIIKYCTTDPNERQKEKDDEEDTDRNFHSFLWTHVNTALTRGFDDNVGRHNVLPVFELPTIKDFFDVLMMMKNFFFGNSHEDGEKKSIFNHLHNCLDVDNKFSEQRCAKALPIAMGVYQEGLPSHYTIDYHENKLSQALQMFTIQARGPKMYDYVAQLKEECDHFWENNRQMCEALSLTGNNCINPIHKDKSDHDEDDELISNQLPKLAHCSGIKLVSSCDCGRRQSNRDDPFTIKAANYDFYLTMRTKCSCGHLERIEFPFFQPSTADVKPANTYVVGSPSSGENQISTLSEPEFESQPDFRASFTNLSQSSLGVLGATVEIDSKKDEQLESKQAVPNKPVQENSSESSTEEDEDDAEDEEEDEDSQFVPDAQITRLSFAHKQHSTTEYLPWMLHNSSPIGLLPKFSSWSLVCLGPSSLYSHNIGVQDQPGFISGTNYLLPWDVTVKLEHSEQLPSLWEGKLIFVGFIY